MLEILFVLSLTTVIAGMALPGLLSTVDDRRARAAATYISLRLHRARAEAARRSVDVALQFRPVGPGFSYTQFADGNGNGVRTMDIQRGIDRAIGVSEHLSDHFRGIDFGTLPDLPGIDGGLPPGADPIRIGSGDLLSFSSSGTCSPATLYIRGRNAQYAVRTFGDTGRIRILFFDARSRRWRPA
jgi:type II secretory pathway pseudopilin PulG